jgi:hypothetical protein
LIWTGVLFAAGVVAARYAERLPAEWMGYLAYGAGGLILSTLRAWLFLRARSRGQAAGRRGEGPAPLGRETWPWLVHHGIYLLLAAGLYLLLCLLLRRSPELRHLVLLFVGALLPDLDSPSSPAGRLLPSISLRLDAQFGRGAALHTPAAGLLVGLVASPLIWLLGVESWAALLLGLAAHLGRDLLDREGLALAWPLRSDRIKVGDGRVLPRGSAIERKWAFVLAGTAALLALLVAVRGEAPPSPPPSYEQVLEQYGALRGNYLVFADVEGAWQATNRRTSGRYEVLGSSGRSLVMLDRYTGAVFSAGRDGGDDLYVSRISLATGSTAQIKPVVMELHGQPLGDALPIVYEMQREPGLQYIYVSGEVAPETNQDGTTLALLDHSGTGLRRIVQVSEGLYRFRWLTASDLVAMARLRVASGELVIVSTVAHNQLSITATPLPSPPPGFEQESSPSPASSAVPREQP